MNKASTSVADALWLAVRVKRRELGGGGLLGLVELRHEARLATGRVVLVNDALFCCLVQCADRFRDALLSFVQLSCLDLCARLLDVRACLRAELAVAQPSLLG